MQIVKPGSPIITKIGSIKALITGVCIREQSINYEIAYFVNGKRETAWIYRYEFDIDSTIKTSTGLKDFNTTDNKNESLSLIELQ